MRKTAVTLAAIAAVQFAACKGDDHHASPSTATAPTRMVEIRSYSLKPGTRDRFHDLFVRVSLPMLKRHNVDVVAYGPSLHDADSWFLMRAYPSLDDRQRSEDEFYGSDEWRKGPREAVMADIESYTTFVVPLDDTTLRGLRALVPGATAGARE